MILDCREISSAAILGSIRTGDVSDNFPAGTQRRRIAVVGSGTAGHVSPALAVARAYESAFGDVEIVFIGTTGGFETRIVPALGYRLLLVSASPFFGVGLLGKLRAICCAMLGMLEARRILRSLETRLVIGLGGYTSAGVLLAARSLGLRTAIHEANIVPGLANRFLGWFVDRIYLGFEAAAWPFSPVCTRLTGNPIAPEIVAASKEKLSGHRQLLQPVRVLVTGGSQGALFLNRQVPGLLKRITEHGLTIQVWHQAGDFDLEPVRAAYAQMGLPARVTRYIGDMAAAYSWSDFAITRSGALTLAELAVCALPALLVPLPGCANDHQTANAEAVADAFGGWWVRESDWDTEALASRIAAMLQRPNAWMKFKERIRILAAPEAAQAVVADCEELMAGQW